MPKTFKCSDGGVVCGATIRGATDDDVLRRAIEHAKQAHGVDLTRSKTLARYAHSLVKEE